MTIDYFTQREARLGFSSFCRSGGAALTLSMLLLHQAYAQEAQTTAPEVVTLPSLIAQVRSLRQLSVPITPAELEHSFRSTTGGANVIEPRVVGSQATFRDIVGTQPGVTLLDFFGGNDHPVVSIRGSGIQSQPMTRGITLLVDGLPVNDADGAFHLGLLEPRNSSMIGVRRGANALNPNSQSLGGEMDFLSHTAHTESGAASFQYGSNSSLASRLAFGRVFDGWDFHIAGSDQRTDGFRDHSRQRRQAFRANLGFFGSGWENRTWLAYTNQHFEIPGPLSRHAALDDDLYTTVTDNLPLKPWVTNPRRHTRGWRIANKTTLYSGPWTHSIGAYFQNTDDEFITPAQVWDMDLNTLGFQYMVDAQFDRFSVGGGLSYSRSSGDFSVSGNPNQPLPPLRRMHPQDFDVEAENFVAQLRAAWEFVPTWTLSGELRFVRTSRDVIGQRRGLNGLQSFSDSWSWISPKIALSWKLNDSTMFFANASTSREAPTLRDMVQFAGPAGAPVFGPHGRPMFRRGLAYVRELVPQRNLSFEIGGRGSFNDQYGWDVTLYHADIEKELIGYSPDGANVFVYNYDKDTRHRGVELGLTGRWDFGSYGNLSGRLAYTYNNFTFRDGAFAGNDIGGLPRHYLSLNLDYKIQDFLVGLNMRGSLGSSYADHANTQKMGSYAIFGAHLSYEFTKDSNFYVQVDNIADKRYISWTLTPATVAARGADTRDMYFPGNGRTVVAGINYRF